MTVQSITVNTQTWNVPFDPAESAWRGANAAVGMVAYDLLHFDNVRTPNCEAARRIAIAKSLSGFLPSGAS